MNGRDLVERRTCVKTPRAGSAVRILAVAILTVLISVGASSRASADNTREYLHYCAFGAAIGAAVGAISVSPVLVSGAGTPGALGVIGTGAAFTCGIAVVGKAGSDIVMWVYDRYISDNPVDNIRSRIADATQTPAPAVHLTSARGI